MPRITSMPLFSLLAYSFLDCRAHKTCAKLTFNVQKMQLKCKSCLQVVGNIVKTFTLLYWEDGFEHCFLFYVLHIFDISPESNATSTERAWENEQFPVNSKNDDDFCFKSERKTNQKKGDGKASRFHCTKILILDNDVWKPKRNAFKMQFSWIFLPHLLWIWCWKA